MSTLMEPVPWGEKMLKRKKQYILVICVILVCGLVLAASVYHHYVKTSTTREPQRFYVNYSLDELQKMQQDADHGLRSDLLSAEQTARAFLEKGTSDQPPVTIATMVRVPDEPSNDSTDMLVYVATLRDGRQIKLMVAQTSSKSPHPVWVVVWYEFLPKGASISDY